MVGTSKNYTLNDVTSLVWRVPVADKRDAELFSNAHAASSRIAKGTAELREACDTISKQSKKVCNTAELKSFIKRLEDNMAFYNASKENLKSEIAALKADCTRIRQPFEDIRAKVASLRDKVVVKHAVIRSIFHDSSASLGLSLKSLVEMFLQVLILL